MCLRCLETTFSLVDPLSRIPDTLPLSALYIIILISVAILFIYLFFYYYLFIWKKFDLVINKNIGILPKTQITIVINNIN
jgi:hypothetical protein